jgi:hypothetical protein
MGTAPNSGRQWLSYAQLVVSGSNSGIDLSNLRFRFEVRANDISTPNTLVVRIYNLSQSTLNTLLTKTPASSTAPPPPDQSLADIANNPYPGQAPPPYVYNTVTLTAGYQTGNQGTIFRGDVIQYTFGRESNVDSFLELACADGDAFYNGAVFSAAYPAGAKDSQILVDIANDPAYNVNVHPSAAGFLTGGTVPNPRGKTYFGMSKLALDRIAINNNCRWSIQNGTLTLIPNTGYLPGTPIQINSANAPTA